MGQVGHQGHIPPTLGLIRRAANLIASTLKDHILFGGFQEMGGDFLALLDDLIYRLGDSAATYGGAAAAIGSPAILDLAGVTVDDFDTLDINPQFVGDNLGEGCIV